MTRSATRFAAFLAFLTTMVVAGPSHADVSAEDKAAARAAFERGRELTKQGKHAEACVQFESSQRLASGLGTLYNLAECYERVGRTASAWSAFLDLAAQSRQAGHNDRAKIARDRANALEPKLSKLVIEVPEESRITQLEVRRDGKVIDRGMWGSPTPVDPGEHVIDATAPGMKPWRTTVTIPGDGASENVEVPALDPEEAEGTSSPTSAPTGAGEPTDTGGAPEADGSTQRVIGLVVGGVGVVGLGVSTILAAGAKSRFNESEPYCDGKLCSQEGVDIRDEAMSRATVATVVGGIGAAALVGGVVLYFTAPSGSSSQESGIRFTPSFASRSGGLTVSGAF